jgi:DNA modification methylase
MIIQGDCLTEIKKLPDESVNCCVTSPPYWALRDYGVEGQLGLEPTFQEYITKLCDIFDEVKRVLRKDGTCWVNIGDTYFAKPKSSESGGLQNKSYGTKNSSHGYKAKGEQYKENRKHYQDKSLCQIPSRFAIEMTNRGWILRNEIIWYKPNCMPSSVKDRFTVDFEKIFFFIKNKKYAFETQYEPHAEVSIKARGAKLNQTTNIGAGMSAVNVQLGNEPRGNRFVPEQGRNKRCVWRITTKPYKEAHFAVFPEDLVETPIKAGCPESGTVLDPFCGSGTTGVVAKKLNREFIGIELNPEYIKLAEQRINNAQGSLL